MTCISKPFSAVLVGLVVAMATLPAAADDEPIVIDRVWVALGVGDGPASDREVRQRLGTDVRLYAVVEARQGGRSRVFTEATELMRGRRPVREVTGWPESGGKIEISWFKLEADPIENGIYDNTGTMERLWHPVARHDHPARWHWCPIDYLETDAGWGNVWTHPADAQPTTTPKYGGLGTMRFVVSVSHNGKTLTSPGKEHRDKSGLKPGIATVRFRRDDTPVGYMTELMNVPYVYGSSSSTARTRDHQTERAVGADCADLVVYGWRRAGRKRQDYTWTGGLKGLSARRVWVADLQNGRYRTNEGEPIQFGRDVRVGDMLLWKGHVAVIAEPDPTGHLTPETKILQTVIEVPALIPLKDIGFGFDTPPFDIRRGRWER